MSVVHISDARIEEITQERGITFVTAAYKESAGNRGEEQRIRLVVERRTIILDANGTFVSANTLSVGTIMNVFVSSAMTRSIPPQGVAYLIEIVGRAPTEQTTTGRILEIDRSNRTITTISDRDLTTIIRFHVAEDAMILNRVGRSIRFSGLSAGMRVRVRHASFMTASIPPQTTAFEIQIL